MILLETRDLSVRFGEFLALSHVDLTVEQGEIHSIIGPNGAGKTSLFNVLTGVLPAYSGTATFRGSPITGLPPHQIARRGISRSFQITSVFPGLSVRENLLIPARRHSRGNGAEVRVAEVLRQVGLEGKADGMAESLSHGGQRHLDIGIALTTDPELLLLDEPTSGMPPYETGETVELILRLRAEHGYTILLIEHKMDIVLSISDRITVLHQGEKLAEGVPEALQVNPDVQSAYLGGVDEEFHVERGPEDAPPRETTPLLELADMNTAYGGSQILHDVSLSVGKGEIVALLGRNGAGKTTTLRSIMGLTPPRSGEIFLAGRSLAGLLPETIARRGVSLVPEGYRVFANLSVEGNLRVPFFLRGIPVESQRRQIEEMFGYFPGLAQRRSARGDTLSGGERQMVAISRALMTRPQFLMLDEPSQGLAPKLVHQLAHLILKIRRQGLTVLLVEQNARMALEVADRVYILEDGRIVHESGADELRQNPEVMHRHLVL